MRRLARVLWSPAAVLALLAIAGCGSQSVPTNQTQPSLFPVTITATGGVAGFQDVLVVAADGLVSVTRKGQAQRQCQLTPAVTEALTTAVSQVAWPRMTPGSSTPSFPDDLVTMVQSPAGGPVRLEDSQIGTAGRVFQELLDDLNAGGSASGMCTPI